MMKTERYITIDQLCRHYELEISFFKKLEEYGLVEILSVKQQLCIPEEKTAEVEKIMRLNQDLGINIEGIDTILNLLSKIQRLQEDLRDARNRLRLYE